MQFKYPEILYSLLLLIIPILIHLFQLQRFYKVPLPEDVLQNRFYTILNGNTPIKTIAFNYNREESYLNSDCWESLINNYNNVTISSSLDTVFNKINNQQKINWLFKWFLAFSVLFLLTEMLILKYFNT